MCLKIVFLAKKTKYELSKNPCADFLKHFPVVIVSNICKLYLIFPPKNLENIRALKIRMRQFFLKNLKQLCNYLYGQ